ncbi:MAG: BadF/BadG/BcrA/BcrD ATPase family protein [Phycisphaerae bacterium]|jgi:N-acetylglucosamine kinase-like BadF-type ATPase
MNNTSKNDPNYVLAGESGGSKTQMCLLNMKGAIIAEGFCPGVAAVRPGIFPVEASLAQGIRSLCASGTMSPNMISHCYFSLGGPNVAEVEKALRLTLPKALIKIGREADGDLLMTCVPYFGCSAAVLAGTGTVAVGESGGKRIFSGGWGPDLDDAGSGGRIGREALSSVLLAMDGRAGKTSLCSMFGQFIKPGVDDDFNVRMALKKNVTALSRKELAALAPDVYSHFLHGDEAAGAIIKDAARGIALLANAVAGQDASGAKIRVMALGGLFKLGPEFRALCAAHLADINDDAIFVFPEAFDLSRGACIMVLKQSGVPIDRSHDGFNSLKWKERN